MQTTQTSKEQNTFFENSQSTSNCQWIIKLTADGLFSGYSTSLFVPEPWCGRNQKLQSTPANLSWSEIQSESHPGETVADMPELMVRVFHMKSQVLRDELCKDGIFSHAVGRIWCIEYQKRGLPHMRTVAYIWRPTSLSKL